MSEVIKFPGTEPEDQLVWVCRCGCQSFILYADGRTECCNCEKISNDIDDAGWFRDKPPAPDDPPELPKEGVTNVVRIGGSMEALDRVIGRIEENRTAFVIVCQKDGVASTWKSDEFDRQDCGTWWLDQQLAVSRKMLLPVGTEPNSLDKMREHITNSEELSAVVLIKQDGHVTTWLSANVTFESNDLNLHLANAANQLLTKDDPTPDLFEGLPNA